MEEPQAPRTPARGATLGPRLTGMAKAKGHKFGQSIGKWCERAIERMLDDFAKTHRLYLDKKGVRPARRGKKVQWQDEYGNTHDLDYVLERGGTDREIGSPVAFIESAWRRYTKHSRNKAQEIQGAILPIRDHHRYSSPFMGCVLAGVYTEGAIEQLRTNGFHVLHFEYELIVEAFRSVGFDAGFDEETSEAAFARKQRAWDRLSGKKRNGAWFRLRSLGKDRIDGFMSELLRSVNRTIVAVRIIPLHGTARECSTIPEAIDFVKDYAESSTRSPLIKYEVQVRYDNRDAIDAQFQCREDVLDFLDHFHSGHWMPLDVRV